MRAHDPQHRRPILSRALPPFRWLAAACARAGVSPNSVSVCGMVLAIGAGLLFAGTAWRPESARVLWGVGAVLVLLRLTCNMLDGMVAVEHGRASATGEVFNEVPDRVSDVAVLVGLGFAEGSGSALGLGLGAALLAVGTAYVRVLGRSLGLASDFRGPMGKQQRMFLVAGAAIVMSVAGSAVRGLDMERWLGVDGRAGERSGLLGVPALILAVISLGCVVTMARRLRGILGEVAPRNR